jgi:hypothetical protein
MLVNFDLTWKSACLEILHYVRVCIVLIQLFANDPHSSPNGHQDLLSKNVARPWSGVSGRARQWIILTDNGHVDRQQRHRTIFTIGEFSCASCCLV